MTANGPKAGSKRPVRARWEQSEREREEREENYVAEDREFCRAWAADSAVADYACHARTDWLTDSEYDAGMPSEVERDMSPESCL